MNIHKNFLALLIGGMMVTLAFLPVRIHPARGKSPPVRQWVVPRPGLHPPETSMRADAGTPKPNPLALRVGVYDNMPLSGVDARGNPQGIFVDVLETIAQEANWALTWQHCNFSACLDLLESGEIDLLGVIAYSPERARRFDFSQEPVITNWGRVYTSPGGTIESILDLDGVPLALLSDDIHAQYFEALAERFSIHPRYQWVETYDEVFQAIQSGEAAAGIVNRMYGEAHAREYNLRASPVIFNPLRIQFAAAKGTHPAVLATIDQQVRAMKAVPDSVYYHSLERWLGASSPKLTVPTWAKWGLILTAFGSLVFFLTSVILQHRLSTQMAELDLQNKRLVVEIQKHKATQTTLRLHTKALEATANSVLITDNTGKILWVNPAYTRMSGFSKEESLGKTPRILKSDSTPPEVHDKLWRTIASGKVWHGELTNRHKQGYLYTEEITITPIADEEGRITHYIAIQQDISERKEQERSQRAQLQISQSLEDATTEEEIIRRVLALLREIFAAQASAFSTKRRGEECVLAADGEWEHLAEHELPPEWPHPEENEVALVSSALTRPNDLPYMGALRLQVGSEPLGYLWIGSRTPLPHPSKHLLQAIQPTIAHALQRARLLSAMRQQLQRINALHAIDVAIASSVDMNITLNILLEQLMNALPVDAAVISLYSPQDNTLDPVQYRNLPQSAHLSMTRRLTTHYIARVMRTRQPLIIPDLRKATQPLDELGRHLSRTYCGYVCVPLLAKGKINGVLEIYSREVFPSGIEWIEFLNILSGQAAIAIENATLFTNLQRSKDELTVSYESALLGWSRSLAIRHREPLEHVERVAQLAYDLAQIMGVHDETTLRALRYGTWLHDVGKLGVPEEILHKSEPLTKEECAIFRRTPEFARQFLADIPLLGEAAVIPVYRYERWDGTGYPEGLSEDVIPLPARIFAVVHTWDARSEERHYMPALNREERIAYLKAQSGRQFDPHIVKVFLESGLI